MFFYGNLVAKLQYYSKMDSTMVYELIQQQLHNQGELLNLIPTLANLVSPNSRFSTQRMNDQQIFAQVYGCVRRVMEQRQEERQALLANVQEQNEEESEAIDEQAGQQDAIENEDEEQQEEGQDIEVDGEDYEDQDQIPQQQHEDEQGDQEGQGESDFLDDEQVYKGQDDVGLYGQQIDEEQMESYENEGDSQEDKEFQQQERQITKKGKKGKHVQVDDEGDDLINDQFDHFREIQLQNKEEDVTKNEQKTDLQKQIQKLESKIISKKDWMLQGQIKATQRPVNSLLEHDLQFKTGIKLGQEITPEQNQEIEKMIKQRILDELYDDRVRYQPSEALREQFGSLKAVSTEKSKQGLAELYESDFKNFLGLGDNKQDKLRAEILDAFKEVNYYLDSLSNFHFTPRPVSKLKGQAVIVEERVPTARWKGNQNETPADIRSKFESEKEEDKKEKRIKNKRIARQRKKEAARKKMNKKIEYGGMTKFEAKALTKGKKNNLNTTNVKYNKSANFFGEMNKDKSKKPNPNISKLKV